ncbi:MAG: phage minor head protein [bacterium]|nr:phage minor head protein [bacterium]
MHASACTCGRPRFPLPVGDLLLQAEALLLVQGSRALTAFALSQKQAIETATAESLAKVGAYSDDLLKASLSHLDTAAKSVKAEILALGDLTQFAPDRQGGKLVQLSRLKAMEKNLAVAGAKLKQDLTLAYQGMTGDMAKTGIEGTLAKLGALKVGGYQALGQAGREALADGAFSLFPANAFDFLSGYQVQLLGKLSDDLVGGIKSAVQVGLAQGEGPAKIARRIGGIVKDPAEFRAAGKTVFKTVQQRAELIARSETMRAYNQGAVKFEQKIGVTKVIWLTAGDERMCPDCEPLDGKEYSLVDLPSQPLHPACRCTHVPGALDLSGITDLGTLETKIAGDALGQGVVQEALKSGDYGKLTSAQLREVAKEKGVSVARTKADRIVFLSEMTGQSEEWLAGHTMNELDVWFKKYKIGALKTKDELLAAIYKADHATDAGKLAALKQAEDAAKAAKKAADEAAAKLVKANQAVADFHSGLAQLKALESDPAQFEAFHVQMDKLLAQVHGNLDLLGPQQAADLGGYLSKAQDVFAFKVELNSQAVLRDVLKAAKVKNFQWFTKAESVTYLTQKPLQPKIAEQVAAKVVAAKDAAKLKKVTPSAAPVPPTAPTPKHVAPTHAPAPKPAPAPAPAASPAVQARSADEAWAELKAQNPFTFEKDASELGGAHTKYFYRDQAGDRWLFKPISEEFRAWGDEVAYRLAREVDPDTVEVRFIELKDMHGRTRAGSIQKMKTGLRKPSSYADIDLATLEQAELAQLQREHVVDWLISNHDGHVGQYLRAQDGHVFGIDKGQLYKFLGKDKLSLDYYPNKPFNAGEPIYNTLMQAYRDGKVKLDLRETGRWIRKAQGISDAAYREMLLPYAGRRFAGKSGALEDFLREAIARKNNLQADFEKFYSQIETARTGKKVVFRFGEVPSAPAATPGAEAGGAWAHGSRIDLKQEVVAIRESGWQGRSLPVDKGDIEDQNVLVRQVLGADGEKQTILQFKLRLAADKRLVKLLKVNIVGEVPKALVVKDEFWDTILAAVKTANSHASDLGFNTSTLRAAEDLRPVLTRLANGSKLIERAMAQQYLKTLDEISHAVEASMGGTATKLPVVKPYAPSAVELKALQKGVVDPVKGKGLHVKTSERWTEDRMIARGRELAVETERVPLSQFYSSLNDKLVEYHVDLGDGVEAVYKPFQGTGRSSGKSFAMQGRMSVKVREGVSESAVARAMEKLKALGLDTAPATALDEELMYLQKVAYAAKIDDSPAFLAAAEEARKATTESAVRIWREAWSRHLGVQDVTKLPDYNPAGVYQASTTGGQAGAGMRVQYRFDVSKETLAKEMEGYVLMHGMTKGSVEDFLEAVLPTNRSFIPTADRFSTGVPIGGMSPGQDMNTGGASYFFTRIKHATDSQANSIRFKVDLLRRADVISYNTDHYGNVVGDFVRKNRITNLDTLKQVARYTGNETIIKGAVPLLEDMDSILVGDNGIKARVVAVFKKHGITVLPDGRRVEDVVKVLYQ